MGFFSKLLGRGETEAPMPQDSVTVEYQSGGLSEYGGWNGNIYDSDIVRAAVWTNAKNAGKLAPKHIRQNGDKYDVFPVPKIKRLLARPNPHMSMSVFINKMVTHCQKKNNAFAVVVFGADGWPDGIYPINYTQAEAIERRGFWFIKFRLPKGKSLTVPYSELIHLRAHFDEKQIFGEDNQKSLSTIMEVVNTTDKGIVSAIKKSAVVRWVLKFANTLQPEDKQAEIDSFVKNYLSAENSGGAAATDPRYTAEQVKPESFVPNAAQMDRAKERILSYFGVSETIIQSKFSESEWNAYYENTIEPYGIQLSEEFTEKLFTQKERDFGNQIVFEANRLQYANAQTKVAVGKFLTDVGAATLDQILEIFNMAPIGGDEGKRRVQTLNMVNAEKADDYQLGDKSTGTEDKTDGEEQAE